MLHGRFRSVQVYTLGIAVSCMCSECGDCTYGSDGGGCGGEVGILHGCAGLHRGIQISGENALEGYRKDNPYQPT